MGGRTGGWGRLVAAVVGIGIGGILAACAPSQSNGGAVDTEAGCLSADAIRIRGTAITKADGWNPIDDGELGEPEQGHQVRIDATRVPPTETLEQGVLAARLVNMSEDRPLRAYALPAGSSAYVFAQECGGILRISMVAAKSSASAVYEGQAIDPPPPEHAGKRVGWSPASLSNLIESGGSLGDAPPDDEPLNLSSEDLARVKEVYCFACRGNAWCRAK
jgi:hypothetical protein